MHYSKSILVVEDSDEDYYSIQRIFKKSDIANVTLSRCVDGEDAIHYITQQGKYAETPPTLPDLILLDLNLPKKNGKEVLSLIKASKKYHHIPIVILTTSNAESDVDFCYAIGANSYIQKPIEIQRFTDAITRLQDYWFNTVLLPNIVDKPDHE